MPSTSFLLVLERSVGSFAHETFDNERKALEASRRQWLSHVVFEAAHDGTTFLREVCSGGIGFGHAAVRRHTFKDRLRLVADTWHVFVARPTPIVERGNNIVELEYSNEANAREGAQKEWPCCWVLYVKSCADARAPALCEVDRGGVGLGHETLRRHVSKLQVHGAGVGVDDSGHGDAGGMASAAAAAPSPASALFPTLLSLKASHVDDPLLAQPLHEATAAVQRLATEAETDHDPISQQQPSGEESGLRERFGASLALPPEDDAQCASGLVALMQAACGAADGGGGGGADELVARLVTALEQSPPTDVEMVRLRKLSEVYLDGMEGYAVASAWLAALFVRTERCIEARSRLTECVLRLTSPQHEQLVRDGTQLVSEALPELLQHLYVVELGIRTRAHTPATHHHHLTFQTVQICAVAYSRGRAHSSLCPMLLFAAASSQSWSAASRKTWGCSR